ncbi:MAG: NUDIX hydrolase [Solobacterium sp.]|nr:NUDIX hydrolase [Solobacterium sp.]MBQ6533176.1 NUDIX hydrolase [Solobacterium sp.]MBR0213738.1 NUDIX hydrolase [Solobacterium sp.]
MTEKRNAKGETLQEFLDSYDDSLYRHPSNTVDMIVMTVEDGQLKVLLIRRKDHPWIGDWALPGGFVNFDEDLEQAALRELQEETNIAENTYFRQLYTLGKADRDPRTRVISTAYLSMTRAENIRKTRAGDDAADARWFTIAKTLLEKDEIGRRTLLQLYEEKDGIRIEYEVTDTALHNYVQTRSQRLDSSTAELAADHVKVINMAMDMVQHRAASTGILFNLLPEEMTLREIQTAYEAVIGHKTDTGNFRRDIRRMLKPTGNTRMVHGRRAATYRFDPMYTYLEENL